MNKGAVIYNVNDHDIRAKANLQLGSVTKVHAKHAEQVSHASLITRKPITSHGSCFSSTVLLLISTFNSSSEREILELFDGKLFEKGKLQFRQYDYSTFKIPLLNIPYSTFKYSFFYHFLPLLCLL